MATKRAAGSSRNGRDSESKRLGVKKFGGEFVKSGNIIIRQRGTKYYPGENVEIGKDHTIFSLVDGNVFFKKSVKSSSGKNNRHRMVRTFVCVKSKDDSVVETNHSCSAC